MDSSNHKKPPPNNKGDREEEKDPTGERKLPPADHQFSYEMTGFDDQEDHNDNDNDNYKNNNDEEVEEDKQRGIKRKSHFGGGGGRIILPPMSEDQNNNNNNNYSDSDSFRISDMLEPIPISGDSNRIKVVSIFTIFDDYELLYNSGIVDDFVALYANVAVEDAKKAKSTHPYMEGDISATTAAMRDSSWTIDANDPSSSSYAATAATMASFANPPPLHTASSAIAAAISSNNSNSSFIDFDAETRGSSRSSSNTNSVSPNFIPNNNNNIIMNNTRESHSVAREAKWDERYNDLLKFRASKGHCMVPNDFPSNTKLAQWVKRQRYQYKLKMAGKASSLTDDRQRNLESIGFVWDSHEAMWMERWEELRRYHVQHGHSNVPASYEANKHLSIWVKCQRRQYKLYRSGKQSNMTLERISKLDALDFDFDPTNRNSTNMT